MMSAPASIIACPSGRWYSAILLERPPYPQCSERQRKSTSLRRARTHSSANACSAASADVLIVTIAGSPGSSACQYGLVWYDECTWIGAMPGETAVAPAPGATRQQ